MGKEVGMFHLLHYYESCATNLEHLQVALAHNQVDINALKEEKSELEKDLLETTTKARQTQDVIMRAVDHTETIASQRELIEALKSQFDIINKLVELMGCKITTPSQQIPGQGEEKKTLWSRLTKRSKKQKIPANAEQDGAERRPSMVSISSETSSTSGYFGGNTNFVEQPDCGLSSDSLSSLTSITEQTAVTAITNNCETIKNKMTDLLRQFEFVQKMLRMKTLEQRLQEEQQKFELTELGKKFESDLALALKTIMDESTAQFSKLNETLVQDGICLDDVKNQIEATEKVLLDHNTMQFDQLKETVSQTIEHALQHVHDQRSGSVQNQESGEQGSQTTDSVVQASRSTVDDQESLLSCKRDCGSQCEGLERWPQGKFITCVTAISVMITFLVIICRPYVLHNHDDSGSELHRPIIADWGVDFMHLEWQAAMRKDGKPTEKYFVEIQTKNGSWVRALGVSGNETSVTVTNLTQDEEYRFRIISIDRAGSTEASHISRKQIATQRDCKLWTYLPIRLQLNEKEKCRDFANQISLLRSTLNTFLFVHQPKVQNERATVEKLDEKLDQLGNWNQCKQANTTQRAAQWQTNIRDEITTDMKQNNQNLTQTNMLNELRRNPRLRILLEFLHWKSKPKQLTKQTNKQQICCEPTHSNAEMETNRMDPIEQE